MTGLVLLTGATGFVGRQVLHSLTEKGIAVRLVIRENTQARLSPSDCIESIIASPNIFSENVNWWKNTCEGVDTIIHCAWYAEPGKYLQSEKNIDCLIGTLQLAKGGGQAGVKHFLGIGTCFEYDLAGGMLSVETALRPLTPYAAAKTATFIELSQYLHSLDIMFTWCRLFYLYGDGEDSRRFVPYLHSKLSIGEHAELTSGDQIRDYLDVSEAGRLIVSAALSKQQGPLNICSGLAVTIRELAERIADKYGRRDLLIFGARPDNLIDPPCVVGVRFNNVV